MEEGSSSLLYDVDLLEVGCTGNIEILPAPVGGDKQILKPLSTLPCGLPPLFPPDVKTDLERYLLDPTGLPIHDFHCTQRFWPRERDPDLLFSASTCLVQTSLKVDRHPTTGEMLGYSEVLLEDTGHTPQNSMSLQRQPGPLSDPVKGQSTHYPFMPGGMNSQEAKKPDIVFDGELDFEKDLLTIPPGFERGATFGEEPVKDAGNAEESSGVRVVAVADVLAGATLEDLEYSDDDDDDDKSEGSREDESPEVEDRLAEGEPSEENLEDILGKAGQQALPTVPGTVRQSNPEEQWAVMVDVTRPVPDFHKRVPEMAHQWPFELDTFQKQAILRLEAHESVFVAAHTSAGKTVVAEYAIALASKHLTRTVYTSPIKALSNQKFRDFKNTFQDVGLLTGDVQINPEASCLIMTTEILRSMLYNGSDVIRDVEWVIFDEVHYVNDAERGVVWEEVLIMLPDHVNIILLSATVPNTIEFADWIGRTKKKKVSVISTLKRPVPLEHFLYTGNSNKTSGELFKLVDSGGAFLKLGYQAAVDAKKQRAGKGKAAFGAKNYRAANPKEDRNVWLSLVERLRKHEQLPVVAFTFSRNRCDGNADQLSNLELTTKEEQSVIKVFTEKAIARLKGSDKNLPQVARMQSLLMRGLAVHHSGILPILKEMIEMLFQKGCVKVLFATETFAMGVNMPAKTVAFDSTRKHDGTTLRDLQPAEYIQMAGRAGRRGLDATGTVIILCKGDVPEMSDLHKMMLGKPMRLESQFRLTYSMILNLLRVEELRVEDMMRRSFAEFPQQRDAAARHKALEALETRLAAVRDVECGACSSDIKQYYKACSELSHISLHLKAAVLLSSHGLRALSPGRVVAIETAENQQALAVILKAEGPSQSRLSLQPQSAPSPQDKNFTVLVICDAGGPGSGTQAAESQQSGARAELPSDGPLLEPFTRKSLFLPEGRCSHRIARVTGLQISQVTTRSMKVDPDKILDDVRKRSMPRFSNDPPCRTAVQAEQELLRLTEENPEGLEAMDPVKDFNIRDIDMVELITRKRSLEASMANYACVHCPKFYDHFLQVRNQINLETRLSQLRFQLSDQSLQHLQEYKQRLQVLRRLRYVDSSTVQLKGRVACEISNHELMITELVFENVFTDLHPADIVALLSCFVFQQRRCAEPRLTTTLAEGKKRILDTAARIAELQTDCGLKTPVREFQDQFLFGLTEAVFEWARGMPFSEITNLTDVQEGVIVRCIQRLDETCRDVRNAARLIGDPTLVQKMEEASAMIKRDIVFAASLYTQ